MSSNCNCDGDAHRWKPVCRPREPIRLQSGESVPTVGWLYARTEACGVCGSRRPAPPPVALRPVRTTIHERVAATLRELAEQADAGDIVGVTVIAENPADYYTITGSDTLSRLQSIGALFEAAMWRARR